MRARIRSVANQGMTRKRLLVFLAIGGSIAIAVATPLLKTAIERRLLVYLESRASGLTSIPVSIDTLHLSLIPVGLQIETVRLGDHGSSPSPLGGSVERIDVWGGPLSLLGLRSGIVEIDVTRPRLRAVLDSGEDEPGDGVGWGDMSGATDPVRALDLHLLSKPDAELSALRKVQDEMFALEDIAPTPGEAEILALYRRYPWSLAAGKLLFKQANKALWSGRAQSAIRSFVDLLGHSNDAKLKDQAQVGYWAALAQFSDRDQLADAFKLVDSNRVFT